MAIDYSGYASTYAGSGGGDIGGSPGGGKTLFAQGLASALGGLPSAAEKLENDQLSYFSKLANQMTPVFGIEGGKLQATDVGGGLPNLKTLPESWKEYKATIGKRIRPNEFALFKEKYDNLVASSGHALVQKFTQMQAEGVKNSTIREYLNRPENVGMRNTLVGLGMSDPTLSGAVSPFLSGGVGVVPAVTGQLGSIATAGLGAPLVRGIGKAWQAGAAGNWMSIPGQFGKAYIPGRSYVMGGLKGMGAEGIHQRLSGPGRFRSERLYNFGAEDVKKFMSNRERKLSEARNRFEKAKKSYEFDKKGKRIKGKRFGTTKEAKKLRRLVDIRKGGVERAYTPKIHGKLEKSMAVKNIRGYIKKHGIHSLLSKIAKKLGPGGALKLIGRLGGGIIAKGTGIGAGIGLGLDALAVYQVSEILREVLAEESGIKARTGLDKVNPMKLLFGGGADLEGTKF